MSSIFLRRLASRWIPADKAARVIAFPIALVVGTAGYFLEMRYRPPPPDTPYLNRPLCEQRLLRQLREEADRDAQDDGAAG